MPKDFFTVTEVMDTMGISRSLAYKLIGNEIPIVRLGRKVLIPGWYIRSLTEEPIKQGPLTYESGVR